MTEEETHNDTLISRLFSVGAHFGYTKSRRHPSARPFIFGAKNKIELIDLEKTADSLQTAQAYARELGKEGKVLLFVTGKAEAKKGIIHAADEVDMPYVVGRWIGGTLTNFPEIRKRVDKLIKLREQRDKDGFSKHTKKERLMFDREIERLEDMYDGIVRLERTPDALFIVDPSLERNAIAEAHRLDIPIISISGTHCDMSVSQYPIPANDKSTETISFVTQEIAEAYAAGARERKRARKEGKEEKAEV